MILILSVVVGFLFWKLVAGEKEGDKFERSFRFLTGDYYFHIHHWIWCLLLLIIFLVIGFRGELILGLLFGSIIQGLLYRDRFVVFYRKDKFEEIYSKFK